MIKYLWQRNENSRPQKHTSPDYTDIGVADTFLCYVDIYVCDNDVITQKIVYYLNE